MLKVPEQYRVKAGMFASDESYGCNGFFCMPVDNVEDNVHYYNILVSDGMGWEHVSISLADKDHVPVQVTPSWDDMCYLKDLFWDTEDCVVQFHPPHSEYVNNHALCLHLWRPTELIMPMPDSIMVGLK